MTDKRHDAFLDRLELEDRIRTTRMRANLAMGMFFCVSALIGSIAVAIEGGGIGAAVAAALQTAFAR